MDVKIIVHIIAQSTHRSYDILYILASIGKCLQHFNNRITHIHRKGNQAVDFSSNQGHSHRGLKVLHHAEGELNSILKLDKINLPYVKFK